MIVRNCPHCGGTGLRNNNSRQPHSRIVRYFVCAKCGESCRSVESKPIPIDKKTFRESAGRTG